MAKEERKKLEGVKIVSPVFRLAFPNLFEPKAFQDGAKPKFSIAMLFPKKSWKEELSAMRKAVDKAAKQAWGDDTPEFSSPWCKGDDKTDLSGYEGMIYANADTFNKPGVFDESGEDVIDSHEVYGGCYARASLICKAWEMKKKNGVERGVKFYLQGIKKYKDGERFGAGGASKHDFDDLEDEQDEDIDSDDTW